MRYVGFQDLRQRWPHYTKMGLHKVVRREEFPTPLFAVDGGKTRIWDRGDIEIYEAAHPEMIDATAKRRKVVGYAIANLKKKAQPE